MITYESKRHPGVFVTSDGVIDPKYKTTVIEYADGTTQTISIATVKRWWKPAETPTQDEIETPDVEVVETNTSEQAEVVSEPIETVLADDVPTITETTESKEQDAPYDKSKPDDFITGIFAPLVDKLGGSVRYYESKPKIFAVVSNETNKIVMDIYVGDKIFKARVRSAILDQNEAYEKHKHNLDATIELTYDDSGYAFLRSLVARSLTYKPSKSKKA